MCLLVIISYYIAICGATVALPLSDNSMTINKCRNLPNNTIIYYMHTLGYYLNHNHATVLDYHLLLYSYIVHIQPVIRSSELDLYHFWSSSSSK